MQNASHKQQIRQKYKPNYQQIGLPPHSTLSVRRKTRQNTTQHSFPGGSEGVKRLSATQETRVWSLGWEDTLEKDMATHSSILAWRIPWTEEPGVTESDTTEWLHFHMKLTQTTGPTLGGQNQKEERIQPSSRKEFNFPWSLAKGDPKHNNF